MGADSLGPVAMDAALADHGSAPLVDGHARLSIGEYVAIENLALAFRLDGDAEFLAIVNPAAANERITVVADPHFREGMPKNLRFLHRADAGTAHQHADVAAFMNPATPNDRIAP